MLRLAPLLLLMGCSSGSAGIPPCNAMIWVFGTADFSFDCPATTVLKLLERNPPTTP